MANPTRRHFIMTGALGTGILAAQQPAVPEEVALTGGEAGRGVDYLSVTWRAVPQAASYEVEVVWNAGSEIRPAASSPLMISGLAANRTYTIRVRAIDASGSSAFSAALDTATRPPKPPAPRQTSASMVQLESPNGVEWDCVDVVAGLDDAAAIRIVVGRRHTDGSVLPISSRDFVSALGITGAFSDSTPATSTYHIALFCPKPQAPNGVNQSEWSDGITSEKMVFGELAPPGVQANRSVIHDMLRDYYA